MHSFMAKMLEIEAEYEAEANGTDASASCDGPDPMDEALTTSANGQTDHTGCSSDDPAFVSTPSSTLTSIFTPTSTSEAAELDSAGLEAIQRAVAAVAKCACESERER